MEEKRIWPLECSELFWPQCTHVLSRDICIVLVDYIPPKADFETGFGCRHWGDDPSKYVREDGRKAIKDQCSVWPGRFSLRASGA